MTVTVRAEAIAEGNRAVKTGKTNSLSSWVNDVLAERSDGQRRLRGMAATIVAYEREHGIMTDDEMLVQERPDQKSAIVVRGRRGNEPPARAAATGLPE